MWQTILTVHSSDSRGDQVSSSVRASERPSRRVSIGNSISEASIGFVDSALAFINVTWRGDVSALICAIGPTARFRCWAAAAMGFITLFMLFYYRLSGVNAVVALVANLLILLGAMAYAGATLTLPGIAGIILTVGVGVDTNVLVFERIREELRAGKTVKTAVSNGFDRVWITILDTHATALIAAAFLFQFGTGAIRGFAITLVWGLIANVFASYFVSKFLFEWVLGEIEKLEEAINKRLV
mgnify:CR=1 FL=1